MLPVDHASRAGLSRAIQLADDLQRQAIRGRLPIGRPLGCEISLCRRFHVGRDTLREAISILEMRGAGRMQRGCKGGLIVDRPSLPLVTTSFSGHAILHGVTATQLNEARRVMMRLAPDMPAPIAEVFTACVDMLRQRFSSKGRAVLCPPETRHDDRLLIAKRRSGQVVREIVASLARAAPLDIAIRFGSQEELNQRFAITKSISSQVVRSLEDMGIMQPRRGRSHGLYVSRPAIQHVTRKIALFLLEQGPTHEDARQARELLSLECVRLAAQQPAEMRERGRSSMRMPEQRGAAGQLCAEEIWRVERGAEQLADNLLLTIMIESLTEYSVLVVRGWRQIVKRFCIAHAAEYGALTVATLKAIFAGKVEAAMRLQVAKNRLFKHFLQQDVSHSNPAPPDEEE